MVKSKNGDIDVYSEFQFDKLMRQRIREVLIVCSDYDHFMLEEDGRIEETLFQEYVSLNLRYPPQFTQVSTAGEAVEKLKIKKFDLVIEMLSVGSSTAIKLVEHIKSEYPEKPVVLLTSVSTEETKRVMKIDDLSSFDYLFSWQGNSNIMLAMVKILEDRMNAEHDINKIGVQCIILVEDSVRFYSSYLPVMYESLIRQAHNAMTEGLNEWQQTIRMRGRPKILMARSYEEAIYLYEKYKDNILGVISDISYYRNGEIDNDAGFKFCSHIKNNRKDIPILLQSYDTTQKKKAINNGAAFINKQTKTLLKELEYYIKTNYGFGNLVLKDPETGRSISYVRNLRELQYELETLNNESFAYHASRKDFSKWLMARSLFKLALQIRNATIEDTGDIEGMRKFILKSIKKYRTTQSKRVIAEYDRFRFDELSFFSRMGKGSLGGKGRGLAFINQHLQRHAHLLEYDNINISIPRTIVVTTQVFDDFMRHNDLFFTALNETDDNKILTAFINGEIPLQYHNDFEVILDRIRKPIAVRSSSLLEDSHHQPFAGIYKTYMLSNCVDDIEKRKKDLFSAIKAVYASTYLQHSKAYMRSTNNIVEDEKMAVIIQEITGKAYGEYFYPHISGVGRSLNYYPIAPAKTTDGIVDIAFGLGETVVNGKKTLRFSPAYPKKIIQLANPADAIKETQQEFFAIKLVDDEFNPLEPDQDYVVSMNISDVEHNGSLKNLVSTYDFENNRLRDGGNRNGRKVLTFSGVLKHESFPLAEITRKLLELSADAMNVPVEIEFAVNMDTAEDEPANFSLLQIRPIVENFESSDTKINSPFPENTIIYSEKALGNGLYNDISDIVVIRSDKFDRARTIEMGKELDIINKEFEEEGRDYILIVHGRLGSTDPWLGIPISWPSISKAKIIVESGTKDFRVEPSQGTHFFQNITTLGYAYITINPDIGDGLFGTEQLEKLSASSERQFFKTIHFDKPLIIKIDGKTNKALIYHE